MESGAHKLEVGSEIDLHSLESQNIQFVVKKFLFIRPIYYLML